MFFLYRTLTWLALAALPLYAAGALLRRPGAGAELRERLGLLPPEVARALRGGVWIQAASVGELQLAALLARGLAAARPDWPLAISVTTPAARKLLGEALPPGAVGFTFPLDLPPVVARLTGRARPGLFVAVETEIWPNLLAALERRGVPVALVNGRIGDVAFRRYRRVGSLLRRAWRPVRLVCARSEEDARRFLDLGMPSERVQVTGDLKLARPAPPADALPPAMAPLLAGRRVLVAGSSHTGEEAAALEAGRRAAASGLPVAVVLAPRRLDRLSELERLLQGEGWVWCRRTRPLVPPPAPGTPVAVLLDTHGELASVYPSAHVALLGGTLAPVGGHNPLEAAAAGVPLAAGPHQGNVRDLVAALHGVGALVTAADAGALCALLTRWLEQPEEAARRGEAGRALVAREQGALDRTVQALVGLRDGGRS